MRPIPVRVWLGILVFFLLLISQMTRVNINLAIIFMEEKFINEWDAKVIILGAFYWCYSLVQIPGSFVVRCCGCRNMLALIIFIAALGNFLFPVSYKYYPILSAIIRALQGLTLGITWPAVATLSSKWIPLHERSIFSSTYQGIEGPKIGSAVGNAVTNLLSGLIIYNFGWPFIFYTTGIISIVWIIFWLYFAYDSPFQHPRISNSELMYLENTVGISNCNNVSIPWSKMLQCKAFWAVIVGTFGIMWFIITIAMQSPKYLNDVHNVNVKTAGLLLCVPDILNFIFCFSFSVLIDKNIKNSKISITNARKFSIIISHLIPATMLIFLGLFGHKHLSISMVLLLLAVTSAGATAAGNLANIVDISPNNAGIIMAIGRTMSFFPGILSPFIVKYFTLNDPSNWLIIFLISSIILMSSCLFYLIYGSGKTQDWNMLIKRKIIFKIEEENINLMNVSK